MRALAVVLAISVAGCGGGADEPVDGRYFGYIRAADAASIDFDRAEFVTAPGAPNDYVIRNESREVEAIPVAEDVDVTAVRCPAACREGVPGDYGRFVASFADARPRTLADDYRGPESQYWITVRRGEVVRIDEQYLP